MKLLFFSFFIFGLFLVTEKAEAQQTLAFQGGEAGDTWSYTSTGASALSLSEAMQAPNKVSGVTSIVVGGNTGGGNCFAGGSGNGPNTPRTFTFSPVDISTSSQFVRTLVFNWGNRYPVCNGTGWDAGENLVFTPFINGVAQAGITLATGNNNAAHSILTSQYTYSIPACVTTFSFVISVTTNRADELLFLDNVTLTAPQLNGASTPLTITGNTTVCQGTTETYSVTNTAGTTYNWSVSPSGPNFSTANGSSSIGINWGSAPTGTYTLTVTPGSPCSGPGTPATLTVTVNPASVPPTITGPTSVCPGNPITLTSGYPTGNTWSTGETTQTITVSAPGTYSVSITGSCGTLTTQHVVTAGVGPTISNLAITNVSCFGSGDGSVSISAAGTGLQYSMDNINWQSSQSFAALAPGTYTFHVKNAGGCISDTSVTITEPIQLSAIASNNSPVCAGTAAQLFGNTAATGAAYSWSGPAGFSSTVQNPTVYTAGIYTLTVSANGCSSQPVTTGVSFTALPVATASNGGPYCTGQILTLSGSSDVSGSTFSWAGPNGFSSTAQNPNNATEAGNYTLTVSANGCTGLPATTAVVVNSNPVASASAGGPYCTGQAIVLAGISDAAGSSFSWTGPNGFTSSLQNPTNATDAGNYTLIVSANGCSSLPASAIATVNPVPAAIASTGGPYCPGQQIALTGTSTIAGSSFSWTGPNGFASTVQNPSDATDAGTYSLTVSANGCTSSPATATVLVNSIPDAQGSYTAPYCPGTPLLLSGSTTATGGSISFSWNGPAGYSSQVQNPVDATATGAYTFTVTQNGCTSLSATVNVVQEALTASASNTGPYCQGAAIALQSAVSSSGAPSYSWTGPNGYVSTDANPSDATEQGVYTLTVTANGCSATAATSVALSAAPIADFSTADVCQGETVHFVAATQQTSQQVTSSWIFDDGTSSTDEDPFHNYSNPGTYHVTLQVQNSDGCAAAANHNITIYARPKSSFLTASDTVSDMDPTVQFVNTSTEATSCQWFFAESGTSTEFSPEYTFSGTDEYYEVKLVSFNELGCSDTTTRLLIGGTGTVYYIPNAFSPDGDEFNNTFQPVFTQGFDPQNFELRIFDRWGEELFESHDATAGWDGSYNGQLVASGTYVWQIVFHSPNNGKAQQLQGHVSLLR